jgi:hypothetical protein
MATGRRPQSDVTLGGGTVAALFFGIVVLCGIFFSLGYAMGRQHALAASALQKTPPVDSQGNLAANQAAPASTGWDFYPGKNSTESPGLPENAPGLIPSGPSAPASPRLAPSTSGAPPRVPRGPLSMSPKPAGLSVQPKPPGLPNGAGGVSLHSRWPASSSRKDIPLLPGGRDPTTCFACR